jgi:hypothetical protein
MAVFLFPENVCILEGEELLNFIDTAESQYIIFADLKAFPAGANVLEIDTYEDFVVSDCELILLIVDSTHTSIYCKDPKILSELWDNNVGSNFVHDVDLAWLIVEGNMAVFRCVCGKGLSNSTCPNDTQLIVFTDGEWELIQERVKEGMDIYDAEPKYDVWRCIECKRIYVFEGNQVIRRYALEKDG